MCGLVCMSLAQSAVALGADASTEAEALIAQGIALREQGKDDQALDVFRRAEAKARSPRATAQVALAEQALGMWVLAETHLAAALESKDDPWIGKNRAALEGALATIQQHVGSLDVRANVDRAEVYVDGALVGTLPRTTPIRVEAGPRKVEVRAPGRYPVSRAVSVSVESMARETFSLAVLPQDAPKDPPRAPKEKNGGPLVVTESGSPLRTVGWVLFGTGVAAAVFGGASLLIREQQTNRYNDRFDGKTCPGVNMPNQPSSCQEILDAETTWRTVGVASFVGAGVLGASGLALVVFAPSSKPKPTAVSTTCAPSLGAVGFSCVGRF